MTNTLDAAKLTDRVAALVEAAKRAGADAADAVAVRGRSTGVSVRLGKVESHRIVRERRRFAARLHRQARCERVGDRCLRPEGTGRARSRHGQGVAGGSLSGSRRSGAAGENAARPRPVRPDRGFGRSTEGGGACGGSGGTCRQGRHQFGRQQRQRRARRAGARHLAWLRRPVCRLALFALGQRHCRRGHRHGARLRILVAPAFFRSRRART